MASIGLCIITKTIDKPLREKLLELARTKVFDHIYVQVNGDGTHETLANKAMTIQNYGWNNNFADARNALLAEVKTDYWTWLDSDDVIDHPERIREVVSHMVEKGVDIMFAPYLYDFNADGSPKEVQNRERIIRTSLKGQWRGRVHETFIPDGSAETENTELITWIHQKTRKEHDESTKRNRELMEYAFEHDLINGKKDPRYAYYLGLNYAQTKDFDKAREFFRYLIEHGGWDEERYRAQLQIASLFQQEDRYPEAIAAALEATLELPQWPDAHYLLQQLYYEMDDHEKSLEWYKVGVSKPTPESDSAFSPIVRFMQPHLLAAFSYLFTGQIDQAVKEVQFLKTKYPKYKETDKIASEVQRAYHEQQAIRAAQTLMQFNARYDGDPKAVLDSLTPTMRADVRLTDERRKYIPGKKWAEGSIVFYCGQSYEPWGPDTLDRGMGGSEEAVVYLAREFAHLGHDVTIYNERRNTHAEAISGSITEHLLPDGQSVQTGSLIGNRYRPWTEINPNDEFDTFIAWRDPSVLQHINARVKLCDLHDIIDPDIVYRFAPYVDKYLFKTNFHRSLYPELADDKCAIVGNGIVTEQFK